MLKFDCIETYVFDKKSGGGMITMYRPRFYCNYNKCMIEIPGDKCLKSTTNDAINYAKEWLVKC